MVFDKYAEAFSRAGLAVLLYDHRNFWNERGRTTPGDQSLDSVPGLP
jgi:hypothetical protein